MRYDPLDGRGGSQCPDRVFARCRDSEIGFGHAAERKERSRREVSLACSQSNKLWKDLLGAAERTRGIDWSDSDSIKIGRRKGMIACSGKRCASYLRVSQRL